ncbi:hypothetical protein MCUN1_003650 [Malassezia cuniculi]|uniref:50S ribosomal protein L10 n=1 Tax=Malassezia cuniculi TaxID=948313 RepID=A0AAF0J800_9BASI|nr:hypothetical protein MCUN1_003650 [Malassezia cuniculi]
MVSGLPVLRAATALRLAVPVRAYATAAFFPYQESRTKFSDRKEYVFSRYERIMGTSQAVIMFEFDRVSVSLMNAIRHQLHKAKMPEEDLALLQKQYGVWDAPTASLDVARIGLLRAVCRKSDAEAVRKFGDYLSGQTMILSVPVLSPKYLGDVLRAIDRPVNAAAREAEATSKPVPSIKPVLALVERERIIDAKGIPALTKLPSLPTLHAQLVGLLSAPGSQIAGILSQAGGGVLAATLDARRRDLEKAQEAPSS